MATSPVSFMGPPAGENFMPFTGWGGDRSKGGVGGGSEPIFSPTTAPSTIGIPPWQISMSGPSGPGSVPGMSVGSGQQQPLQFTGPPGASGMTGIGKGMFAQNPLDPALTSQLFQYLQSQIGAGASPFDLSTLLPSSGQATAPGQLNAPLNELLKMFQGAFAPGTNLGNLANKGIDQTPLWQTMVDAMQRQIGQGRANLKESFNVGGGLVGSPYGTAAADYELQSNKDLNSLLGQLQFQGIDKSLAAAGLEEGAGQFTQGLDQQAIQNMLQEFIRTRPEYSPLLGEQFGAATTFPPVLQPQSGMGGIGGLLSGIGPALAGIAKLLPALAGLCWIAEVLYGVNDSRTHLVRSFLLGEFGKSEIGSKIVSQYKEHGRQIAEAAKTSPAIRATLKPIFELFLQEAQSGKWRLRYA